jgi:nitrous oxidase accessory protein
MKAVLVLLFFHVSLLTLLGKDIYVGPSQQYVRIADALEAASSNDRIIVEKGFYQENNLVINKAIQLVGKDIPVIDGSNSGDIIIVRSDSVRIEGFTIQNSGFSSLKDYAGIKVENSSNCTIEGNQLVHCYFAIYLSNTKHSIVSNNILNGKAIKESNSGNGIHLWKCAFVQIEFNEATNHRDGIYLEFSESCQVANNLSKDNLRYGLHFMFSHGNVYVCNVFRNNGAGVAVMYTENIEMTDNIFEENWGPTSYGLLLKDIRNSTIRHNKFKNNTIGVYMEGANNIQMTENEFISNGWGVKFMGNCVENSISNNNFLSNTFDIATNSFEIGKQNYTSGNFWDKYKGYDLNKDAIGDEIYRPISLFSIYVEKIPHAIVLLRSFMVDLLDSIEQAVPALIPETLSDHKPLMKRIPL